MFPVHPLSMTRRAMRWRVNAKVLLSEGGAAEHRFARELPREGGGGHL